MDNQTTDINGCEWSDAQMDWMRHLIRLNQDRIANPVKLGELEIKQLKWELGQQQRVLMRIAAHLPFDGSLIPEAVYMRQYADLHLEWYSGCIGNKALRETLLANRQWMIEELQRLKETKEGAGHE